MYFSQAHVCTFVELQNRVPTIVPAERHKTGRTLWKKKQLFISFISKKECVAIRPVLKQAAKEKQWENVEQEGDKMYDIQYNKRQVCLCCCGKILFLVVTKHSLGK